MTNNKYWETETPQTATTAKNVLEYYPIAGMLSVGRPKWTDENGVVKAGKTVGMNIKAILDGDAGTLTAARDIFADIVDRLDKRLSGN